VFLVEYGALPDGSGVNELLRRFPVRLPILTHGQACGFHGVLKQQRVAGSNDITVSIGDCPVFPLAPTMPHKQEVIGISINCPGLSENFV
jgi:hypothetical protein